MTALARGYPKNTVIIDMAVMQGIRVTVVMNGIYISEVHGINGNTPEETMRNMGLIASPGMVGTEKTIVEIFEDKLKK